MPLLRLQDSQNYSPALQELKHQFSVIIPVSQGTPAFKACLESLSRLNPQPYEIIVVANGDQGAAASQAREKGFGVVSLEKAVGPACARNHGALAATGEILFFIDADVEVPASLLQQADDLFFLHPEIAAWIGSYDQTPGEGDFLSQYRNLLHHYVHQQGSEKAFTFWGACGAVRRQVFLQLQGFDENYEAPSIEDIELGYRMNKAGYEIGLCKEMQVKHLKKWELANIFRTDLWARAVPWTELILSRGEFKNDLNLSWGQRLSVWTFFAFAVTLFAGILNPAFLTAALLLAGMLLLLNFRLYQFFNREKGWRFTLKAIPVHWFYFFCCGLGFAIGYFSHFRFKKPDFRSSLLSINSKGSLS